MSSLTPGWNHPVALITLHHWKIIIKKNKDNVFPSFHVESWIIISALSEHNEIPIRPFQCVNSTFFIVLMGELLIKTRACLSRVSCRLIDLFSFCRGFVQALIRADLQPHVKEETERRGRGLSSPWYICVWSVLPPSQLLKHWFIDSHDWRPTTGWTPDALWHSIFGGWLSKPKTPKRCFLIGLGAFQ